MPGAIWNAALALDVGTRPDVYINFEANPVPTPNISAAGIVHVIGVADWGPVGSRVAIRSDADADLYLGANPTALRAAVLAALDCGALEVSFHRIAAAGAAAATKVLNDGSAAAAITVSAKYPGTFGNLISVAVTTNLANGSAKDVTVYYAGRPVEVFTGVDNTAIVADFTAKGSRYISMVVTGTANRALVNAVSAALSGGDSGTAVLIADYSAALTAAGQYNFSVLALDTSDDAIQAAAAAWVAEQRQGGVRFRHVAGTDPSDAFSALITEVQSLNSESTMLNVSGYTVSALNAGYPASGPDVTIDSNLASIPAAAIVAVAGTASVTNRIVPNAIDVTRKLSPTEYQSGLTNGLFIFSFKRGSNPRVVVEQGLNTLSPAAQAVAPRSKDWRKIRYIAIQDEFATRVGDELDLNFKGKVENDARGQSEAVRIVQLVLEGMVQDRLIQPGDLAATPPVPVPTAYLDPRFVSEGDRIYVAAQGQFIDAAEKFFLTARI